MALAKAIVPVKLGVGVDLKSDPKQMQGSLLKLENAVMTRTGEFKKRNGFSSLGISILGATQPLTTGVKLASYNQELNLIDARALYSYGSNSERWSNRGPCPTTSVSTTNVVTNSYEQTNQDACYSRNTTTYVWEDSRGGVRAMVVDQTSGARLIQDVELNANGIRPRAFAVDQYHFVYYYDTVAQTLVCRRVDTANPSSFSNESIIAADINTTTPIYDVCLIGTSRMVVAYRSTAPDLKVATVLLTGSLGGIANGVQVPTSIVAEDPDTCITCFQGIRDNQRDTFWVSWFNAAAGVKCLGLYSDFTTYKTSTVVDSGVATSVRNITGIAYVDELSTASELVLYWERDAAADINHYIETSTNTVATNTYSPTTVFQRAAGLASKAYRSDLQNRVMVSYASAEGFQNTYFSLSDGAGLTAVGWGFNWGFDWGGYATGQTPSSIQAKVLSTVAGGHSTRSSQLPGTWLVEDYTWLSAQLRKTRVVADNTSTFTLRGINLVQLNHRPTSIGQPAQLGQNLHIPGGFLKMYDGETVVEHSYHLYPESITTAEGATGSIGAGTYQHVVVWEWIDAKGQIHRSAPSIPVSVTISANKHIDVTIPTLRYTAKTAPARSEVIASVYRTVNGGTVFYKVSSDTSPLYNDTTVDTITFNDTTPDASLTSRPLLYTTGGTLENTPVSSCDVVVPFKNRLFAAGLEQDSFLRYSKEFVQDEGVAFSEALQIGANSGSGGVKALAVLDDKLVIFKSSEIFVLTGSGPTDTGDQNDFQPPQQVSTDVGCVEPESVVLTPKGVMFKSAKGIYLLDRGTQTVYVGDRVQEFNSLNITAAVLVPDVNQVRFTTLQGTTLVYDYYYDAWSVYTKQAAVSATSWQDTMVYLQSDGQAKREIQGSYDDDGVAIRTVLETSWMSLSQLMGFQRLYRLQLLGSYVGNHTLRATLSYDFQEFNTQSFTIVPAAASQGSTYGSQSPYGTGSYGGANGVYTFEIKPQLQKCTSFKLRLEDLFPDSDTTGGFTLSGVSLIVGSKQGLNKLPNTRTMT